MRIVKYEEKIHHAILIDMEQVLRAGGTVVAPTDTVYGILGDATNEEAIQKIFAIKQRPQEKVFPIFVKDIATARRYAYISDAKARFLEKVWPGAVIMVFHHKGKLPSVLTGGLDTLGVRIPDHPFLQQLLGKFDTPLVQTSANITSKPTAQNIEEIKSYFADQAVQPDLVVDAGEIVGQSSTVIDFTCNEPIILRSGLISKSDLDALVKSRG